ncbi:MAG: hypothetical protein C3F11_19885 [Methylocystaceae bacterium]|nr:MAG: hypothetical protein C3F11_19885 [Methylocystaceae bacterium]
MNIDDLSAERGAHGDHGLLRDSAPINSINARPKPIDRAITCPIFASHRRFVTQHLSPERFAKLVEAFTPDSLWVRFAVSKYCLPIRGSLDG